MTEKGNKAGGSKTASKEYVKREAGDQQVPHEPAQSPGNTSPTPDDLDNAEKENGEKDEPTKEDDAVGKKIHRETEKG